VAKLVAVLGSLVGILAVVAMYFKGRLSDEKLERAEEMVLDEKAARELSNLATEALIKGVTDENTKERDNRKYDFGKSEL